MLKKNCLLRWAWRAGGFTKLGRQIWGKEEKERKEKKSKAKGKTKS